MADRWQIRPRRGEEPGAVGVGYYWVDGDGLGGGLGITVGYVYKSHGGQAVQGVAKSPVPFGINVFGNVSGGLPVLSEQASEGLGLEQRGRDRGGGGVAGQQV
jgi:hypothetical protein